MSQYNHSPADNAGWKALDPELAPFLPTTNQSGGWNPRQDQTGTKAGLPSCEPRPWGLYKALHSRGESHNARTCAACSASFRNNHQLAQHATKTKHKAYLCTCGKAFTKLSALRRHVEESTQAREHQCPQCGNEFKRPGHVEQHLRLIHHKAKDEIKKLLDAQKSGQRQDTEQASTGSAAVCVTGSMDAQADQPMVVPGGPWTGPIGFSAPAPTPVDHPGSQPGYFSAFPSGFPIPAPAADQMIQPPTLAPQSLMTQASGLHACSAYAAGAMQTQAGLPANPAPAFAGYPAALSDGELNLPNLNPVLASMNHIDGFGMAALESDFMGDFIDFDLNNFDF